MGSKQITSREDMKRFVLGGNATFTLVSKRTGKRFTFRVNVPNERRSQSPVHEGHEIMFVSLLSGPDNEGDYTYLGTMHPNQGGLVFHHGRKSRVDRGAPSVQSVTWFLKQLNGNGTGLDQVEFWHEGKCGRCGRKLTVPESIESGFGPECVQLVGMARRAPLLQLVG